MPRDPYYIGANKQIAPEDLPDSIYERSPEYVAARKTDGMWVRMTVGDGCNSFMSRNGKEVTGERINGLATVRVPQTGAILVGELLASTEWATEEYKRVGYRQIKLFDLARDDQGRDLYKLMGWQQRYDLLKSWWQDWPDELKKRLVLKSVYSTGFKELYDQEIAQGGEGIIMWRTDYRGSSRSDGKSDAIIKCKKLIEHSYVLMGVTRTATCKEITGRWGLYINGRLTECLQGPAPDLNLNWEKWIGRVADFKGNEIFKSGSMRSAHFMHWRDDLDAKMCTPKRPTTTKAKAAPKYQLRVTKVA
jgi:ATP-dependent DNA ligase